MELGNDRDPREITELEETLKKVDVMVNKKYYSHLSDYEVIDISSELKNKTISDFCSIYKLTSIVYDKNESVRDKLATVYQAILSLQSSFALLVEGKSTKNSIYIIIRNEDTASLLTSSEVLENTLKGNFPGTTFEKFESEADFHNLFISKFSNAVAMVNGIPGLRFKDESKEKQFVQGLEKLIDTMREKEYSLLIISEPITKTEIEEIRDGYTSLYTEIVPFASSDFSFGESEGKSIATTLSKGTSEMIGESLMHTETNTKGSSDAVGANVGVEIGHVKIGANYSHAWNRSHSISEGRNKMTNKGTNELKADMSGEQSGITNNLQIKFENRNLKLILEKINLQLKRINESLDLGMWNCAAYCLGETPEICKTLASAYNSLIRGENSSVENSCVTFLGKNNINTYKAIEYIHKFCHPVFKLSEFDFNITPASKINTAELAILAGLPLKSIPGLPIFSMSSFERQVLLRYDGEVKSQNEEFSIRLGRIYHMGQPESLDVNLNMNSLASHTFITGSTGSGKSNTIYQMLSELSSQKFYYEIKNDKDKEKNVKFLVIEPAKGEYKNVFGMKNGVSVYGTNPDITLLLRLNPFSFPHENNEDAAKNIHILEHLDRLIEIFNVCWPMYAAMPAVLKEAVEKSYEDAGWDLTESKNPYGENLYPTFADVARNVRTIIDSSEYDAENKGAYKGALITRLKSLTNGINGLIFTTDEISEKDLFDENVIVDLSRVGSAETKSLIMGLLVLKLQEYCMTSGQMNESLKHITVLEEAHNLLKRTSTEQTSDSGNLRGKSVEMLSNAIAEMRTYGEGFIIADQAPALLDMSVIRNTNTKIIMRLPDQSDRELVGKAANLNDDQITELARLPCGVAAVYQNEWVESVLCKVEKFEDDRKFVYAEEFAKMKKKNSQTKENSDIAENMLKNRIDIAKLICSTPTEPKILKDLQDKKYKFSGTLFVNAKKYLDSPGTKPNFNNLSYIVSELLPEFTKTLKDSAVQYPSEVEIWRHDLQEHIESVLENFNMQEDMMLRNNIMQCVLQNYILNELNKPNLLKELQPKAILEMER